VTFLEYKHLGFFKMVAQSGSPMVSPARKTFAILWMSWCALDLLAVMALRVASWSSLKSVGTGPAVVSPSNMIAEAGQL